MKKSIREKVLTLIESDTGYNWMNEKNIKKLYKKSGEHFDAQDYIDKIFMNLTGYSLQTILDSKMEEN